MRKFLTLLAVLVLFGSLAFSQSKIVTGRVTDQAGQPVPFATIRLKGTKLGTSADAEGNFTIKAESSQTLNYFGNGYHNQRDSGWRWDCFDYSGSTPGNQFVGSRCNILGY